MARDEAPAFGFLWYTDVDLRATDVLDLRPLGPALQVSSSVVISTAEKLAASGYAWVVFYEGVWEGVISPQAVYLGSTLLNVHQMCTSTEPDR